MRGGAAVSQDVARANAVQARSPANTGGLDDILVVQQGVQAFGVLQPGGRQSAIQWQILFMLD